MIGKSAFIFGLYHVRARRTSCDKIREKTSRLTAKINRMASKIEASFLLLPPKVFFSNYQFFVLVAKSRGFAEQKEKESEIFLLVRLFACNSLLGIAFRLVRHSSRRDGRVTARSCKLPQIASQRASSFIRFSFQNLIFLRKVFVSHEKSGKKKKAAATRERKMDQ